MKNLIRSLAALSLVAASATTASAIQVDTPNPVSNLDLEWIAFIPSDDKLPIPTEAKLFDPAYAHVTFVFIPQPSSASLSTESLMENAE